MVAQCKHINNIGSWLMVLKSIIGLHSFEADPDAADDQYYQLIGN
jgi:hypothetical protein